VTIVKKSKAFLPGKPLPRRKKPILRRSNFEEKTSEK
jgi:hypothetical protein